MNNKQFEELIKCPYCGYNNKKYNVKHWGTCTKCRKVLDKKEKFKMEMYKKLMMWRKK